MPLTAASSPMGRQLHFKTMNYEDTIDYLYHSTAVFEHIGPAAYKPGLQNTLDLDAHFGHPHRNYLTLHVAGTNGKGSCSHMLAAILQSDGYKVGLYTSPHLVDFSERIRVNGKCISQDYVTSFVEENRQFIESVHPSFFELVTAMAFSYFASEHVDIAVIEVGLGGRLDCTNIITPEVSVITNISFDHMQFLGNTLAQIAGEKAGIIKKGVPVVIGETTPETKPVFEAKAADMQAPIHFAETEREVVTSVPTFSPMGRLYQTVSFGDLNGDLAGKYQEKNVNTVLCTARLLLDSHLIRDPQSIVKGIAHASELTGLMGRWQKVGEKPNVVCDTGHNVGGWQFLGPQISAQPCQHRRIVFGMVDDKDLATVMTLLPADGIFYFTRPSCDRAFPVEKVAQEATKHGIMGKMFQTVQQAYEAALRDSSEDDFIFVGGSSYVVADFLTYLGRRDQQAASKD